MDSCRLSTSLSSTREMTNRIPYPFHRFNAMIGGLHDVPNILRENALTFDCPGTSGIPLLVPRMKHFVVQ